VNPEPLVDVLEVLADRRRRDTERGGDLGVGLAERDPLEDLALASREAVDARVALVEEKDDEPPGARDANCQPVIPASRNGVRADAVALRSGCGRRVPERPKYASSVCLERRDANSITPPDEQRTTPSGPSPRPSSSAASAPAASAASVAAVIRRSRCGWTSISASRSSSSKSRRRRLKMKTFVCPFGSGGRPTSSQ
jgi:hypothetical protein